MPELANMVVIDKARRRLYVNGVEFPWVLTAQGATLDDSEDLARVTITLLAEDVITIGVKSPSVHVAEHKLTHAQQRLDAALRDARNDDDQLAVRDAQIEIQNATNILAAAQIDSDRADDRLRETLATE